MILEILLVAAAVGGIALVAKKYGSSAVVVSIKAEVAKLEASGKAEEAKLAADIKALLAKLKL